jgi:hypothetical protein
MSLPVLKSDMQELMLMQSRWKAAIDPALASPLATPLILENVVLQAGANVISTRLGRKAIGWIIVDIDTVAAVYRSAPTTKSVITLTSSGPAICKLLVF